MMLCRSAASVARGAPPPVVPVFGGMPLFQRTGIAHPLLRSDWVTDPCTEKRSLSLPLYHYEVVTVQILRHSSLQRDSPGQAPEAFTPGFQLAVAGNGPQGGGSTVLHPADQLGWVSYSARTDQGAVVVLRPPSPSLALVGATT